MELNKSAYSPQQLARLDANELADLLQSQLQLPTQELNGDYIRQILRELEARGKDPDLVDDEAVLSACDKFRRDVQKRSKSSVRWYSSWLVKAACIVGVLGIILISQPRAEAETLKDVLTRWTDSVFQFFSPDDPAYPAEDYVFQTDHPGLQQLYDTVTEQGVTDPVVPMWVPDGFELQEIKTYQLTSNSCIYTCLLNGEKRILITIIIHGEKASLQYEKNKQNVKTFEMDGVEHYKLTNQDEQVVTWVINNVECSLATDCPEDAVYDILRSIYASED